MADYTQPDEYTPDVSGGSLTGITPPSYPGSVSQLSTGTADTSGFGAYHPADPDNPLLLATMATNYGDIKDVTSGQDNGLNAHGGANILHRDTGQPITENDVQDVRSNPHNYVNTPEYVISFPKSFYSQGLIKPNQVITVGADDGTQVSARAGEVGPGEGPFRKGVGADLNLALAHALYGDRWTGKNPITIDASQFLNPDPQIANPVGHPDRQLTPDHVAYLNQSQPAPQPDAQNITPEDVQGTISQVPQRAQLAGDEPTDASMQYANMLQGASEDAQAAAAQAPDQPVGEKTAASAKFYPPQITPQMIQNSTPVAGGKLLLGDGKTIYDPSTKSLQYQDPAGNTWINQQGGDPYKVGVPEKPKANTQLIQDTATNSHYEYNKDTGVARKINLPGGIPDIDPSLHGNDVISALPPNVGEDIKAMANYEYPKVTAFALGKPMLQKYLTLARQYDPGFDARKFESTQKAIDDLGTGRGSNIIMKSNEALGQVPNLVNNIDRIGNKGSYFANWMSNIHRKYDSSGDASVTDFEDSAKNFSSAAAAQLKGGNAAASAEEIGMHTKGFDANLSSDRLLGVTAQKTIAMLSQLDAEKQRAIQGLGDKSTFQYKLINDKSIGAVQKLIKDNRINQGTRDTMQDLLHSVAPDGAAALPTLQAPGQSQQPASDQDAYNYARQVMQTASPGSQDYQNAQNAINQMQVRGVLPPSP